MAEQDNNAPSKLTATAQTVGRALGKVAAAIGVRADAPAAASRKATKKRPGGGTKKKSAATKKRATAKKTAAKKKRTR
jgi:hypothetical protein